MLRLSHKTTIENNKTKQKEEGKKTESEKQQR